MTEAQAWRAIAAAWRHPVGAHPSDRHVVFGCQRVWCYGLCASMRYFPGLSDAVRQRAGARMLRHRPQGACGFWWSFDERGAAQRVAFCLRMARLATPKPRKKSPATKRKAAR